MERFIQQQIPPTPTRSVPNAPCPSCPVSALVGSPDKSPVSSPAIPSQSKEKTTAAKASKPSSKSKNKK